MFPSQRLATAKALINSSIAVFGGERRLGRGRFPHGELVLFRFDDARSSRAEEETASRSLPPPTSASEHAGLRSGEGGGMLFSAAAAERRAALSPRTFSLAKYSSRSWLRPSRFTSPVQ